MSTTTDELLDTAQIAELLHLSRKHVTDRLTKAPGFPRPEVALNRKTRRWWRSEVLSFARDPQPSRAAMSAADSR